MIESILLAIWFMLPAAVANASPIFISRAPYLDKLDAPIDGGKKYRGKEILGSHKTWRGLMTGIFVATLVFMLQKFLVNEYVWAQSFTAQINYHDLPFILGPLLGLGALGGDAVESFFKRQKGVKSGEAWVPFDQLDYILGAVLLSMPIIMLEPLQYVFIFAIWFGAHLIASYVGYRLKLKDAPI